MLCLSLLGVFEMLEMSLQLHRTIRILFDGWKSPIEMLLHWHAFVTANFAKMEIP